MEMNNFHENAKSQFIIDKQLGCTTTEQQLIPLHQVPLLISQEDLIRQAFILQALAALIRQVLLLILQALILPALFHQALILLGLILLGLILLEEEVIIIPSTLTRPTLLTKLPIIITIQVRSCHLFLLFLRFTNEDTHKETTISICCHHQPLSNKDFHQPSLTQTPCK